MCIFKRLGTPISWYLTLEQKNCLYILNTPLNAVMERVRCEWSVDCSPRPTVGLRPTEREQREPWFCANRADAVPQAK